jgi:hypothetical protein
MKKWIHCYVSMVLVGAVALMPGAALAADTPAGGAPSLEERVKQLEAAVGQKEEGGKWFDRIQVGGLMEVEAGYGEVDFEAGDDAESSDVDLATVDLAVDADIAAHLSGHILFKWEDDDLFVDEGFVTLAGGDAFPAYLIAGRQYVPFGYFDTHFVTDPNTLILGETNEGAAMVGYRFLEDKLDVSLGAFNGRAREAGGDDRVDSYVAAVKANPLEGVNLGFSYISNLAGANGFDDGTVLPDPENLDSLIGGWSAFVTLEFLDRFKLIGEYVTAMDDFEAGEIYDAADTEARKPSAWNAELGVALVENVELAIRYGGSDDGGTEFLPATQYGAVINWALFDNTNLALEYLHGEYEDDFQETDSLTVQLAIEF